MVRQVRPKKVRVEFDLEKEEGYFQEWYSPEDLRMFRNRTKEIIMKLGCEAKIDNDNIYLSLKGRNALFNLAGEFLTLSPQADMTLREILENLTGYYLEKEGISTLKEAKKKLKIE